jgi:hypothetical protein
MILRHLDLRPREKERYFDFGSVILPDGNALYIERCIAGQCTTEPGGPWNVIWTPGLVDGAGSSCIADGYIAHENMDEFEAQAVLDHYIQQGTKAP